MSRVVIVGGGVIGLATAWHCARRGHEVTVVDRLSATRDGCSFGNAGMVVPSHFVPLAAPGVVGMALKWMLRPDSPFYLEPRLNWELAAWCWRFFRSATAAHAEKVAPLLAELNLRSRAGFQAMVEAGLEFGLKENGLFMLCRTEAALEEEIAMAERASELGLPVEVLDAAGTSMREPGIEMDISGSVFYPLDCHLNPQRFMSVLETALREMGVRFEWEKEIRRWRCEGERVRAAVMGPDEEIEGDEFVLCAGIWSPETGRDLELDLPMQAGRGYSVTLEGSCPSMRACAILTEARVAVTPMGEGLRLGGTMEITGKSAPARPKRVAGIVRSACEYFPGLAEKDLAGLKPWVGLRPCPPDGLPYLGRPRRWSNFIVASGHSMMGLSLAPVTGETVANLLEGAEAPGAVEMLSPDRFKRR